MTATLDVKISDRELADFLRKAIRVSEGHVKRWKIVS
jgi:hypothetical protein